MWQKDLIDTLLGSERTEPDYLRAATIREAHRPHFLYRYRPVTCNSLANLREGTEWLSGADSYNDPYDSAAVCQITELLLNQLITKFDTRYFELGLSDADIEAIKAADDPIAEMYSRLPAAKGRSTEVQRQYGAILSQVFAKNTRELESNSFDLAQRAVRICSFSEEPLSLLIWGHYADQHRGFCIEYPTLHPDDPISQDFARALWPVYYCDDLPDTTYVFKMALSKRLNPNIATLSGVAAALVKALDWQYEKEWRIATVAGLPASQLRACDGRITAMPKPTRLLLGCRISAQNRKTIETIARQRGIPVQTVCPEPRSFRLRPSLPSATPSDKTLTGAADE